MALAKAVLHTQDLIMKSKSVFQMYVVLDKNFHMMVYASIVKNIPELLMMVKIVNFLSVNQMSNCILMVSVRSVPTTLRQQKMVMNAPSTVMILLRQLTLKVSVKHVQNTPNHTNIKTDVRLIIVKIPISIIPAYQ